MTKNKIYTIKNNPLYLLRKLKAEQAKYVISNIDLWNAKDRSYDNRLYWMKRAIKGYERYKQLKIDYMTILKMNSKYKGYRQSESFVGVKNDYNKDIF